MRWSGCLCEWRDWSDFDGKRKVWKEVVEWIDMVWLYGWMRWLNVWLCWLGNGLDCLIVGLGSGNPSGEIEKMRKNGKKKIVIVKKKKRKKRKVWSGYHSLNQSFR